MPAWRGGATAFRRTLDFRLPPTVLATAAALLITNAEAGEPRAGPIPAMPRQAATAEGFVPARWRLEAHASGDLNGDGVADLALVIAASEDVTAATPRPRILAMATGRPGGGYVLAAENHTLVPPQAGNDADDPINGIMSGDVEIRNGALVVSLGRFSSIGSWEMGTSSFTFRYRDRRLMLVGYDNLSVNRGTSAISGTSVNYLTRRVRHKQGTTETDRETVSGGQLRPGPLLRLQDVGDGPAFIWKDH